MRKRELDENNRAIRAIVYTSIVALILVAGCGKGKIPPRAEAGPDQNNIAVGTEVTLDAIPMATRSPFRGSFVPYPPSPLCLI
jgi:hypothetical protein